MTFLRSYRGGREESPALYLSQSKKKDKEPRLFPTIS